MCQQFKETVNPTPCSFFEWRRTKQEEGTKKVDEASTTKKPREMNVLIRESKTRKSKYHYSNLNKKKTKRKNKTTKKVNLSCLK